MKFFDLRKKIGTQEEVAKILNISQQTIAVWEHGKSYPRRNMLKQLSALLGVSEQDILVAIDNSKAV